MRIENVQNGLGDGKQQGSDGVGHVICGLQMENGSCGYRVENGSGGLQMNNGSGGCQIKTTAVAGIRWSGGRTASVAGNRSRITSVAGG